MKKLFILLTGIILFSSCKEYKITAISRDGKDTVVIEGVNEIKTRTNSIIVFDYKKKDKRIFSLDHYKEILIEVQK